ncbi:L-dopachrome tautomerase-related protein [Pelagibius sp. 7325]|uniref:L-dopachrome tautomerase-related protein n=1 Tax=Pelagibius sp. 7325 TaxID=3131994 RepID=UPI0030EC85AC
MPRSRLSLFSLSFLLGGVWTAEALPSHAQAVPALSIVAESDGMVWNAVAVDGARVFVAGPRWISGKGPAVAKLNGAGHPIAYPGERWNSWRPAADPAAVFVSVNAIHLDGRGGLWAIDTGTPGFGEDPLPGAPKAVRIELASGRVERIYRFGPDVALPGSYIDDIRFHGDHAYLTDAGRPGLIVLNLTSGAARRVLDGVPAVTAPDDRPIILDGEVLRGPDGTPVKVNADPLEVSPDGQLLYFGTLHGPWYRIETRLLDDPNVSADALLAAVEPWADLPPVGGTVMDRDGNLYFTDLAANAVKRRSPDGSITTVVQDSRLHWIDAPILADGTLWLPVPQIDRAALFHGGVSRIAWPVRLYRFPVEAAD